MTLAPPLADPTDAEASGAADLEAREISAWFGTHQVLDRVSLAMEARRVTALIGPSGCGKSTFLRILNRMHELIPGASLAGDVLLDGEDIYDPRRKLTDARRHIGMVFQKPNPFPTMSIYDNVLAGLRLTGERRSQEEKDELVRDCLMRAGLWNEVEHRLREMGGALSGGQQQRLCIARALAIRPRVLLMDEPCSALDPTSTRRIETDHRRVAPRGDHRHRDPQHAAGPPGIRLHGLLPGRAGHARIHHRARPHRGHVRLPPGPEDDGLRPWALRLSSFVFMARDSERLAAEAFTRASVEAYLQAVAERKARLELAIAEADRRRQRAVDALEQLDAVAPPTGSEGAGGAGGSDASGDSRDDIGPVAAPWACTEAPGADDLR